MAAPVTYRTTFTGASEFSSVLSKPFAHSAPGYVSPGQYTQLMQSTFISSAGSNIKGAGPWQTAKWLGNGSHAKAVGKSLQKTPRHKLNASRAAMSYLLLRELGVDPPIPWADIQTLGATEKFVGILEAAFGRGVTQSRLDAGGLVSSIPPSSMTEKTAYPHGPLGYEGYDIWYDARENYYIWDWPGHWWYKITKVYQRPGFAVSNPLAPTVPSVQGPGLNAALTSLPQPTAMPGYSTWAKPLPYTEPEYAAVPKPEKTASRIPLPTGIGWRIPPGQPPEPDVSYGRPGKGTSETKFQIMSRPLYAFLSGLTRAANEGLEWLEVLAEASGYKGNKKNHKAMLDFLVMGGIWNLDMNKFLELAAYNLIENKVVGKFEKAVNDAGYGLGFMFNASWFASGDPLGTIKTSETTQ